MDDEDVYGTFTEAEASRLGVFPSEGHSICHGANIDRSPDSVVTEQGKGARWETTTYQ